MEIRTKLQALNALKQARIVVAQKPIHDHHSTFIGNKLQRVIEELEAKWVGGK